LVIIYSNSTVSWKDWFTFCNSLLSITFSLPTTMRNLLSRIVAGITEKTFIRRSSLNIMIQLS